MKVEFLVGKVVDRVDSLNLVEEAYFGNVGEFHFPEILDRDRISSSFDDLAALCMVECGGDRFFSLLHF